MRNYLRIAVIMLVTLFCIPKTTLAQTTVKKVVLQAFWWDYWNSNHPGSWANYLTELAPRLKAMGIDAIWIPPISKGNSGVGSVGYDVFDHYDLGDKYQKSSVTTRVGTKDELLRMIAVMHSNGIEVIQDVVLNHTIGAGDLNGELGKDPAAPDDQFKNFRYSSYGNHAVYLSTDNYLTRSGRWPKNHQNFHPNPDHNCNSGEICSQLFGPDICYYSNANGQSSNATFNPAQGSNYMRNEARSWVVWLKKQTGVDGFRWDATKHFPVWVQQDLSFNLKYVAGFANGEEAMFNVGEYVDFNGGNLDNYVNSVTSANGGSDFLMGTFDFSLRAGMKSMIDLNGFYDMSALPGTQQNQRVAFYATPNLYVHRTVPFVNNHDTFRPQLDANGNYIGWNSGSELAPHIDPFNDRMPLAYAVAFAVDGAPQIFFEDLFNIGGTSKRYSHEPTNSTDLPIRAPLEKIITLHQQLDFKSGAYKVRSTLGGGNVFFSAGSTDDDLLIIERSGKAIIAMNDNGSSQQEAYVDTDFPAGTILVDHAGYVAGTSLVFGDQRALIKAPPVDPTNGTFGFSIWGPQGALPTYTPGGTTTTTQEWEMNDDLGDSHPFSLKQGGQIPDNSTDWRYAGKIFVEAGKQVSWELFADAAKDLTVEFITYGGTSESVQNGLGNLTGSFMPTSTGWLDMRIRNTTNSQTGQVCFLKVTYTAPATIPDVSIYPSSIQDVAWNGAVSTQWQDAGNWQGGQLPDIRSNVVIPAGLANYPEINTSVRISALTVQTNATCAVLASGNLEVDILSIEADHSGYGIFQSLGTTTVNDNLTHQQYLDGSGWHHITPTVANRPVSDWGTVGQETPGGTANTKNLYNWNPNTAEWVNVSSGASIMQTGSGYNLYVGNYGVQSAAGTISTTGEPISSYTPSLFNGSSVLYGGGWNFVGNSLTAPLDFSSLATTDLENAFYIWDASTTAYKSWSTGGITDPHIAPMQGFWVKAVNGGVSPSLGTIDFSNSVLTPPIFYKTSPINAHIVLNLSCDNPGKTDQLVFGLLDGTIDGYDSEWDAYKLLNHEEGINLFSVSAEDRLAINTVQFGTDDQELKILPIGFENLEKGQEYCIELDRDWLNQSLMIYVNDIQEGELHRLEDSFCFDAEANQNLALVLSTKHITADDLDIVWTESYIKKGNLIVNLNGSEHGQVEVFDISGRLMFSTSIFSGENTYQQNFAPGVYLIKTIVNTEIRTEKLVF